MRKEKTVNKVSILERKCQKTVKIHTVYGNIIQVMEFQGLASNQLALLVLISESHASFLPNHKTKDCFSEVMAQNFGNNKTRDTRVLRHPKDFKGTPKIRISKGTPNELPNLQDSIIFYGDSARF